MNTGGRGREKEEVAGSEKLHPPHPDQHARLMGIQAARRLINLPLCNHLKLSGFCLGEEERWRGHCLPRGKRMAESLLKVWEECPGPGAQPCLL